jgi:hypothetical protein
VRVRHSTTAQVDCWSLATPPTDRPMRSSAADEAILARGAQHARACVVEDSSDFEPSSDDGQEGSGPNASTGTINQQAKGTHIRARAPLTNRRKVLTHCAHVAVLEVVQAESKK